MTLVSWSLTSLFSTNMAISETSLHDVSMSVIPRGYFISEWDKNVHPPDDLFRT